MSARAPTGQGLLPPHPVPLPPVQSLARAWPRLSPCPAGAGDLQLRVPVGAEGACLSSGTILPWPSGSAPQPLSSHRLCTGTNEHSCCLPGAARGVVAVGARRMYGGGGGGMDVAGACSGCDQRAPCPGRLQPLPPCSGLLAGVRSPWEVPNAAASGPWPRLGGAPLSLQVPSQVGTTQPRGQGVLLGCSPGSPRAVKPGDDARDRM